MLSAPKKKNTDTKNLVLAGGAGAPGAGAGGAAGAAAGPAGGTGATGAAGAAAAVGAAVVALARDVPAERVARDSGRGGGPAAGIACRPHR